MAAARAARLPVSTFIKLGTVALLAVGLFWVRPDVQLPAITKFIDGTGPVFAGKVFPFCFITIACGAISGFHALISSGTTPKLLDRESDARFIGYGAMLLESFVAIMAMIAACVMQPGRLLRDQLAAALIGSDVASAAAAISGWGFPVDPAAFETLTRRRRRDHAALAHRRRAERWRWAWPRSSRARSAASA